MWPFSFNENIATDFLFGDSTIVIDQRINSDIDIDYLKFSNAVAYLDHFIKIYEAPIELKEEFRKIFLLLLKDDFQITRLRTIVGYNSELIEYNQRVIIHWICQKWPNKELISIVDKLFTYYGPSAISKEYFHQNNINNRFSNNWQIKYNFKFKIENNSTDAILKMPFKNIDSTMILLPISVTSLYEYTYHSISKYKTELKAIFEKILSVKFEEHRKMQKDKYYINNLIKHYIKQID